MILNLLNIKCTINPIWTVLHIHSSINNVLKKKFPLCDIHILMYVCV